MIEHLEINNFKSIKSIDLDAKQFNLFIGHPNTGKSNILEAIGLVSWLSSHSPFQNKEVEYKLSDYIRCSKIHDLFFDYLLDKTIEIKSSWGQIKLNSNGDNFLVDINGTINHYNKEEEKVSWRNLTSIKSTFKKLSKIKLYRFNKVTDFSLYGKNTLATPSGKNMFPLILNNSIIKQAVEDRLDEFGFKLIRQPHDNKILVQKENLTQFEFQVLSDTIKSIIFYTVAILSNENNILLFEEPEEKNFPFYSKEVAELIIGSSNQYFIITHNPYFLRTIIENAPLEDVQINLTYLKNGYTKIKQLTKEDVSELLRSDPFFNLEKLIR